MILMVWLGCAAALAADLGQAERNFRNPPAECRTHTRWWWMGNAMSKDDITYQLGEMQAKGIGGVEQITMQPVYERGNHAFLSAEYFELMRHAIGEARRRGMEFSVNFGGPGWIWGGEWVSKEERNKNMVASAVRVRGPRVFEGELPLEVVQNPRNRTESLARIRPEDKLLAVVAGEIEDGRLKESTLVELTARVKGRRLTWKVPAGRWQLMAFWQAPNGEPAVDHLSKTAMEHYCEYLGGKFRAAFGEEFGETVESMFMDSFEVPVFRNGLYWSTGFLDEFRKYKGYELTRYLPAIWWEVDEISPRIRYDVNEFLDHMGFEAFFKTFVGWCERNHLKARIQPYGFVTDIIRGAGMAHIPEIEITAGEKDAVPWYDLRIGPRVYPVSGAHLYGRNIVSVEAYTYQHWEPGRETLEELKISSDIFLRAGANKFYNSGYTGTPEKEWVPGRRFGAEIAVSHPNVWWPYYRYLSDYVARCSVMMRQGRPVADVAVYSPLANQWTLDVLNARRWTRDFDWGDLAKLLVGNGYDFDLVNDDVLQHRTRLGYPILILPNIHAMPLESLRKVEEFAREGGVVIALEQKPAAATGFIGYQERDAELRAIADRLFARPNVYFLQKVIDRKSVLELKSSAYDPFVNTLRRYVTPDFGIDFVREGIRENPGLIFAHRRTEAEDIYFVTNVQDRAAASEVAFRVKGKTPREWNPYTGEVRAMVEYRPHGDNTVVPVRLAPYASTFYVFGARGAESPVVETRAVRNGRHCVMLPEGDRCTEVKEIPAPYEIPGRWRLSMPGMETRTLDHLVSWTEDAATKHFSGTGHYEIEFELPECYRARDLRLELDAGDVGNVAEVEINGRRAGVIWMRGQRLDVTELVTPGRNAISVKVTNTLINRVSGWKHSPPLPPDLAAIYGRGLRDGEEQIRSLYGFEPLPRTGLLGPVVISAVKTVRIKR
jgi:hypothetical protein